MVGAGMGLFAAWGGFDPMLVGGLSGVGTVIIIMRFPHR